MAEPRYSVQFRIGRRLLRIIDQTAKLRAKHISRNAWIIEAIHRHIQRGFTIPIPITARTLLHDRIIVMVRVDALTLETMNETCEEEDDSSSRTIWIMDAILSMIAEEIDTRQRTRVRNRRVVLADTATH